MKKTSCTEVTEISQSNHDRKVGHAYRMTKKGHILIDLEQFKDKTSLSSMEEISV